MGLKRDNTNLNTITMKTKMLLGWLPWKWSKFNKGKPRKGKNAKEKAASTTETKKSKGKFEADQWRPWLGYKHRVEIRRCPQPRKGGTKKKEVDRAETTLEWNYRSTLPHTSRSIN
jgi:hypothetical protein